MKVMLSLVCSLLAFQQHTSQAPLSVMKLRGGMNIGPINPGARAIVPPQRRQPRARPLTSTPCIVGNFNGALKVAAAVTAASAITEKYADLGETALTKTFKGDVFNTNLIIAMVTGAASSVVYSVGASPFDTAKLTAVLWLASVLVKLKDANFDMSTLKDGPIEKSVTVLSTLLAFA